MKGNRLSKNKVLNGIPIRDLLDSTKNTLVLGSERAGKSATVVLPMLYELLLRKKRGDPLGFTLLDMKLDVADKVAEMCKQMEIPLITSPLETVERDSVTAINLRKEVKSIFADSVDEFKQAGNLGSEFLKRMFIGSDTLAAESNLEIPHYVIVDGARYFVFEELPELLRIARRYNIRFVFTCRSLWDLEGNLDKANYDLRNAILKNIHNYVVFDAFQDQSKLIYDFLMLDDPFVYLHPDVKKELKPSFLANHNMPRFTAFVRLQDVEYDNRFESRVFVHRFSFVPSDWREQKEWLKKPKKKRFLFW